MKHTPGPWLIKRAREIFPDSKSAGFLIIKQRPSIEWKGKVTECQTIVAMIPDNPRSQVAGNCKLLAAAPELAAALAWALGRLKLENSTMLNSIPYANALAILNGVYENKVPANIEAAVNTGSLRIKETV